MNNIFTSDVPISTLSFGRSLSPKNILSGADVYFECHVKANPTFYNITWRQNVSLSFFKFPVRNNLISHASISFFDVFISGLSIVLDTKFKCHDSNAYDMKHYFWNVYFSYIYFGKINANG